MTTNVDLPTGIRDPAEPSRWLVPPWSANAVLSAVVRHFLQFEPAQDATAATKLVYYEGYAAALTSAPTQELDTTTALTWYDELRIQVAKCALVYGELAVFESTPNNHTE